MAEQIFYWDINYFRFIIYFYRIGIFCVRRQSIYITTYVFREYKTTTTDRQPFSTFFLSLRICYDLLILLHINRKPLSLCFFLVSCQTKFLLPLRFWSERWMYIGFTMMYFCFCVCVCLFVIFFRSIWKAWIFKGYIC